MQVIWAVVLVGLTHGGITDLCHSVTLYIINFCAASVIERESCIPHGKSCVQVGFVQFAISLMEFSLAEEATYEYHAVGYNTIPGTSHGVSGVKTKMTLLIKKYLKEVDQMQLEASSIACKCMYGFCHIECCSLGCRVP